MTKLLARFKTWLNRREYKKNVRDSKVTSAILYLNQDSLQSAKNTVHPLHEKRIPEYIKLIQDKYLRTISFGDSVLDLIRSQLTAIDGNFNVSGEWAKHTLDMILALYKYFIIPPKNVVAGCFGGNPMLVYEDFEYVKKSTIECLNTMREEFPTSNLIIYGCPPNYSINVVSRLPEFEKLLFDWCVANNAHYINLYELFKGIFPCAKWSSDGIHLTSYGGWKLNKRIRELSI